MASLVGVSSSPFPTNNKIVTEVLLSYLYLREHLQHLEENEGEQEEDEDDEQNGIVAENEALLELLGCKRNTYAGLRAQAFYLSIKLHKYEAASSTYLENKEHCCICLEDYCDGEELGKIDCGHVYHVDCIKEWIMIQNSCPICKREMLACLL